MIKVIINADDFGKSVSRNRAINDAFKQGLICSAGTIVTGKHLLEAVEYANRGKYVDHLHLHFNLSANLLHEDSDDTPLTEQIKEDSFFCTNGKFLLYKGLPKNITAIFKWKIVYRELVAQYERFKEVTKGEADYKHIDFHLWYNLTWPVSIALYIFNRRYNIESVRFIGIHQMDSRRYMLLTRISKPKHVQYIPATNIDYYVSKRQSLDHYKIIELYCHPNYKEGVFLDDSPSYLKHERKSLLKQIQLLKDTGDVEFISWEDIL